MHEEQLFYEALACTSPDERARFLDRACAGDPALRASVEALLQANVGASGFLERSEPVPEPVGEQPGSVIGPYRLMELIGEGGMLRR